MKHSSKWFVLLLLMLFVFSGCDTEDGVGGYLLPDLTGLTRQEITNKFDQLGASYRLQYVKDQVFAKDEYDQFQYYQSSYKTGDYVKKDYQIYIYTSPMYLTFSDTFKNLHLDSSKITPGHFTDSTQPGIYITQVKYVRNVDGDTSRFCEMDASSSQSFSVRYLGIDTPESTIQKEAWGKAASYFTQSRLENAKVIVLESEEERYETLGDRWLAYVWYGDDLDHLSLLNLEICEHAFSVSHLSKNAKYYKQFAEASSAAAATGRRYYGEKDPGYNYTSKSFVSNYYSVSSFMGEDR
jgi:endonuclease YncB( thermonuclease family)